MTRAELEQYIKDRIYPNNAQEITGEALQDVLLRIAENGVNQKELAEKQNTLISGKNIKTYGGQPIIGYGDLLYPMPNEIWYTSTDGKTVIPFRTMVFGSNIVSNTYDNGKGIIIFDAPVTSIGTLAFYYCRSLTSITIPDSVTSIGDSAFRGCRSLTSVTIPDSVTSIGSLAFEGCTGELTLNCRELVEKNYTQELNPSNTWLSGAKFSKIIFGDAITTIGDRFLIFNQECKEVVISDNVTFIGQAVCSECPKLEKVFIGKQVETIYSYAFQGNPNLTKVNIPDSVTLIGGYAFANCPILATIVETENPPTLNRNNTFDFQNGVVNKNSCIIVPNSALSVYKSATNWSEYAGRIIGTDYIEYAEEPLFVPLVKLENK